MADKIDGGLPETSGKIPWYKETFTCEGLTYTWPGLIKAMGLILLGFFTYTIAAAFVPAVMPLKLQSLGANSKVIVIIMSTIGQILNITICPMVSFQSDRYRSKRWGRRIPFILYTMPMMIAAWVLFAFVDSEAGFLSNLLSRWCTMAPATMSIVLIALIMVLYQFFFMYVASVIYYIYNDTIPTRFLSRIAGLVQVVCACGAMLFNFLIFKHGMEHYRIMLLLIAAIYTVGVGIMCIFTKEPRFPDPPPLSDEKRGLGAKVAGLKAFFAESFSHKFYWYLFFGCAFTAVASCTSVFNTFYFMDMGLDLEAIGKLNGSAGLVGMFYSFAVALAGTILIDRWHPVRVFLVLVCFDFLYPLEGCKWLLFSPGGEIFWAVALGMAVVFLPLTYFRATANMPLLMRLFPKSRFGQFCSAQAMFRSGVVLLGGLVYGAVIDILKTDLELGNYAYRFGQLWNTIFFFTGGVFYVFAFREFLKLGGFKGYRAPAPWSPDKFEPMPVTEVIGAKRSLLKMALLVIDIAIALPVLSAVFFSWWSKRQGMDIEAGRFLMYALPATAAVLVFWFIVRAGIGRDVRRVLRGESPKNGIPHHGILFIVGGTELAAALNSVMQTYMGTTPEASFSPAYMLLFETAVAAIFVGVVWFYTKLERGASTMIEA